MNGEEVSCERAEAPGTDLESRSSPDGSRQVGEALLCVRVFVLSGRMRSFGRGIECELRSVQGSRVGMSGGARTRRGT